MIVIISHGLFIPYLGGAETEIIDLLKKASDKGHEIHLITNSEHFVSRVKQLAAETHILRWPNEVRTNLLLPFSMVNYIFKLNKFVKTIKPDSVLCGSRYDFMALSVVKRFNHFRQYFRDYSDIRRQYFFEKNLGIIPKFVRFVFFKQLAKSDGILTQSEYDVNFIKDIFSSPPSLHSVHSGIDLQSIGRKPKIKTSRRLTIGTIARLAPAKGLENFVEAVALAKKETSFDALIVGDGESKNKLMSLSKESGAEIDFIGYKKNPAKYYKKIDIFVQPSLYEGWSRTVSEALAHGCALVVSDIPTQKEQVESGKYGVLFKTGSSSDLASKLIELVKSPEKIVELSSKGFMRANEISNIDTIISEQILPIISK